VKQLSRRNLTSGTGLVFALALFLALNIVSNVALKSVRFDMTENHIYTLSEGTRNILAALDEPITLRLYLSKKLASNFPDVNSYSVRVRELLEQYRRAANGKITLEIIDPEPFSEEEDRAVGFGLQGIPVEGGTATFYFGLAGTNSTDKQEVIPFLQPDRADFLEYDLTQLIYRLAHPKPPVVGVISTLPIAGGPPLPMAAAQDTQPWVVYEQMSQLFDMRTLGTNISVVPKDVDVLLLVHPTGLTPSAEYAIDQFVMRGGRVLAFVDPDAEADRKGASSFGGLQTPQHSDLGPLLKAWGVTMADDKIVGDVKGAKKIRLERGGREMIRDYPIYFDIPPEQMDTQDIVTANLDKVTVASPGALEKAPGATTTFTPLLRSSTQSMTYAPSRLLIPDPDGLMNTFHAQGQFTVAARITGEVNTAFPDGPPKDDGKDKDKTQNAVAQTPGPQLKKSAKPANIIVVADTDMLEDRFWVHTQNFIGRRIALPTSGNGNFVINALDNLGGSNDLISVRSRGNVTRPFTKVRDIQQSAEQRFRSKEQELRQKLQDTEQQLRALQSQKQGKDALILSSAQEQEVAHFRQDKVRIRKELRNVQHQLRKDIESLETWVKFINIGLIPILIGVGGVFAGLYRPRRKQPRPSAST
jgi:ABC-type uncharacterized transport system involved in gliding motility auxiliary subunit